VHARVPAVWWMVFPVAFAIASLLTAVPANASPIDFVTPASPAPTPQVKAPAAPVTPATTIKPKTRKVCSYRVRKHDWLSKIARRFDVPLDTLITRNPQFSNPNIIWPGQRVHLCASVTEPVADVTADPQVDTPDAAANPDAAKADPAKAAPTTAPDAAPTAQKKAPTPTPKARKVRRSQWVRVHSGDTLQLIASRNHQSLVSLLARNRRFWRNIHSIDVGQIVRLRGPKHHVPLSVIRQIHHVASAPSTVATPKASPSPSPAPTSAPAPSGRAAAVLSFARAQLGESYVYGATGPNHWDCSGLTQAAYRAAGISIPRTSSAQSSFGSYVSRSQLRPGDLVFFYSPVSHVGIYVGHNTVLHAPHTGAVVRYESMSYMPFAGARRP
jgi:cell wall-associated NlpC family hydrolase